MTDSEILRKAAEIIDARCTSDRYPELSKRFNRQTAVQVCNREAFLIDEESRNGQART